jgi:acyl-CoA synthetase (AMP-forming)/AMP-acid ligase II
LLETSLKAAKSAGIPENRIYILEMPKEFSGNKKLPFKTVSDLIALGEKQNKLAALAWEKGQGKRQTAYLCYSSGTSGLPVSHHTSAQQLAESF